MPRIKLAVYLGQNDHKIGPGKVRLLEAIDEHGSISAAARALGMAYRHAWEFVDDMNRCFSTPVVARAMGGRHGGGAKLTPWGRELIERFRNMEEAARRAIAPDLDTIVKSTAPAARSSGKRAASSSPARTTTAPRRRRARTAPR